MFLTRLVKEKPLGFIGGIIVLLFLLTGIFADWLAPYGMNEIRPVDRLQPPSTKYLLGTDHLGRDMLSRIIFGARVSMIVGIAAGAMTVLIALVIGVPSGVIGGRFDMVVQRFVDGWLCFPLLVLFLAAVSVVGPGLLQIIIVLGLVQGIAVSRIIRSAVIKLERSCMLKRQRRLAVRRGEPLSAISCPILCLP